MSFTVPGRIPSGDSRTDICGNHTDHQRGVILAGAVNLNTVSVVAFHEEGIVRVCSEGYTPVSVCLADFAPKADDEGTTALVRGVIAAFAQKGILFMVLIMYVTSDVICGGGISSSAAFEVMLGTVIDYQYNRSRIFCCDVLSQVDETAFYEKLPALRNYCADRAILRAMHFSDETKRTRQEADALENKDMDRFLRLVNASGQSSADLLQNLYSVKKPADQTCRWRKKCVTDKS